VFGDCMAALFAVNTKFSYRCRYHLGCKWERQSEVVEASIDGCSHKRVPNRRVSHENRLHLLSALFQSLLEVTLRLSALKSCKVQWRLRLVSDRHTITRKRVEEGCQRRRIGSSIAYKDSLSSMFTCTQDIVRDRVI
jgi:hypothetical protein